MSWRGARRLAHGLTARLLAPGLTARLLVHGLTARSLRRVAVAALAVCAVWAGDVPSAHADQVTLSAQPQDGFGRLRFVWPQPVGHAASVEGDRLVVRFARPIEADLRPALRNLGGYIASIEPAPNQATVVFQLKNGYTVRSFDSGPAVVVDIVGAPQGAGQPASAQPADAPARAPSPSATAPSRAEADGPRVPVRTGVHDAYSRIVFDWTEDTRFVLARNGNEAVMSFGRPARVDLGGLAGGDVPHIDGVRTRIENGNLVVTFQTDPTSRINAFASGTKVVVDVYPPGTAQGTQPGAQTQPAPEPAAAETPEPTLSEPAAPEADAAPTGAQPTALTPPAEQADGSAPDEQADGSAPDEVGAPEPSPAAAPVAQDPINARAQARVLGAGAVALQFDWDDPVGAAVFRRGNALWVVFDRRANIDTDALVRDGEGLITSAEQVPSNMGAAVRLTTAEGVNPEVKRKGLAWILEFMEQPLFPAVPLQADAQPNSPLGARLFVSVPEPGNVIAFRDPEVGDNLMVVPVIPLGHGVSRPWSYPQLTILPTKQGVVVRPLADDVRVRPLRQGVEVTSTGALQVSSVSAEDKANVELEAALASSSGMDALRPLTRVLDLEKWKRADLQDITAIRQELQRDIAFADSDRARERTRRELAQFYFTNGFEAEALGVMEMMRMARPEIEDEPQFRMMRGAASWLMWRLEDARRDLFSPVLDGTDEATFWRAAVVAREGNLEDAAFDLRRTGAITQPYPKPLKMPTATLVAEAAVELGDVKQARQYLDVLAVDDPSSAQQGRIAYVSGMLKELSGDPDGAVADFEAAMESRHRPSRARAAVARTELLLKQEHFTAEDAIEEFEKLRFVWRGDDFEFKLLRRLGNLYLDQDMYREGLNTLRQAATHFPDHEDVNQVTKTMSDTFKWLYLEDGADGLAPVTAIALYDEFRELTPAGAEGDEMIRQLADRLVEVDLLERAADLLESQVDFRLQGEPRARVGARLALIYLFDRRPEQALAALDKTEAPGLEGDLAQHRLMLRARTHMALDQPQMALDLVQSETGLDAERIRADVYWNEGNWRDAARALTRVLRDMDIRPRQPLSDQQALTVMQLAVAHTLDRNETAVARMVASYGQAMANSPFADAYELITTGPERDLVNYKQLDDIVQTVDDFQSFMRDYRQRVAEGQLSSLYEPPVTN